MAEDTRTNEQLKAEAQAYLQENGYTYRSSTLSWQQNGAGVTPKYVRDMLCYHVRGSKDRIGFVMTKITAEEAQSAEERAQAWVAKLETWPRSERALRRYVTLMQREGTSAQMHEAHVLLLKQWMWQVKRHIMRLEVTYHIVPVFWSREGATGKSQNVNRILSPLKEFTRTMGVSDLTQSFTGPLLAMARVIMLDEMAGANKTDSAFFKTLITGKEFNERVIHDGSGYYAENRLSCIGTSNMRPPFGFKDETGGRRFWPVHCSATKPAFGTVRRTQLDLTCVNSVWAAVSVEEESPFSMASRELRDFIEATQETYIRTPTPLKMFVDDCLEPHATGVIYFAELHEEYMKWCRRHGMVPQPGGKDAFVGYFEDLDMRLVKTANKHRLRGWGWKSEMVLSA